ncbi:hypothetical protein LINPERPRIM_LOCUS3261 [Linum perenne]
MAYPSKSSYFVLFALYLAVSFSNVEVGASARQLLQLPIPAIGSVIPNLPPLPTGTSIPNLPMPQLPPLPTGGGGLPMIPAIPDVPGVPVPKIPVKAGAAGVPLPIP